MDAALICGCIEVNFDFLLELGFVRYKSETISHKNDVIATCIYKNSETGREVDVSLFMHPDDIVIPVICISNDLGQSFTLLDWSLENNNSSKFVSLIIDNKELDSNNILAFLDGASNILRGPLLSAVMGCAWYSPPFNWHGYK